MEKSNSLHDEIQKIFQQNRLKESATKYPRTLEDAGLEGEMLLNTKIVSQMLGVSMQTLEGWRNARKNLPYYKAGKTRQASVFYRAQDVHAYMASHYERIEPLTVDDGQESQ